MAYYNNNYLSKHYIEQYHIIIIFDACEYCDTTIQLHTKCYAYSFKPFWNNKQCNTYVSSMCTFFVTTTHMVVHTYILTPIRVTYSFEDSILIYIKPYYNMNIKQIDLTTHIMIQTCSYVVVHAV